MPPKTLSEYLKGMTSVTFMCRSDDGFVQVCTYEKDTPETNQGFASWAEHGWTTTLISCRTRGNVY